MKRFLALFLAAALAASLLILPAEAAGYSDLTDPETVRAAESLGLMGVMDGYGDGTFRPGAQLTRAQFCKMAVCAMDGEGELGLYRATTVYPDVKPSHWAAACINMASKGRGIIAGYADGRFYPDRPVTLGQACTILLRMLGWQDKTVGGLWPDGYVAAASRAGLLEGVSARDGGAPLTRGQAALLFVNLLKADCVGEDGKKTGTFLSSIGAEVREDAVLVSSSAQGPDGVNSAFQLASGELYQLSEGKTSGGALNGTRGTLALKDGRVLTFLPESGTGRTVALASASALRFTDASGNQYAVKSDTGVYYNGKEQPWSEVYPWLNPGAALTLYLNDAGNPAYIVAGGGTAAEKAVVVYKKGSADGFDSLTGGAGGWTVYKNGSPASLGDLRPYDVAVYSGATNSVRVTDTRITGSYESCRPGPAEAAYVTVMGHEFPVLTTAQASLAAFRPGDRVTLLLTEDNQVAGAVKPENASGNVLGVVKSASEGSAEVALLCGVTVKGRNDNSALRPGQLVRADSQDKGVLRLYAQSGGVRGDLDLTARKLGSAALAESVTVLKFEDGELKNADFSSLPALVSGERITYARTNWAGKVDLLLLDGEDSRDVVLYGRATITYKTETLPGAGDEQGEEDSKEDQGTASVRRVAYVEVTDGSRTLGPYRLNDVSGGNDLTNNSYVAASVYRGSVSVRLLTRFAAVPNTAWAGRTSVTVDGRSRAVAADAVCWNKDTRSWVTLDQARAYADRADLYASADGVVRVLEVGG